MPKISFRFAYTLLYGFPPNGKTLLNIWIQSIVRRISSGNIGSLFNWHPCSEVRISYFWILNAMGRHFVPHINKKLDFRNGSVINVHIVWNSFDRFDPDEIRRLGKSKCVQRSLIVCASEIRTHKLYFNCPFFGQLSRRMSLSQKCPQWIQQE